MLVGAGDTDAHQHSRIRAAQGREPAAIIAMTVDTRDIIEYRAQSPEMRGRGRHEYLVECPVTDIMNDLLPARHPVKGLFEILRRGTKRGKDAAAKPVVVFGCGKRLAFVAPAEAIYGDTQ